MNKSLLRTKFGLIQANIQLKGSQAIKTPIIVLHISFTIQLLPHQLPSNQTFVLDDINFIQDKKFYSLS